jgi:SAM-dependent methyltransferase
MVASFRHFVAVNTRASRWLDSFTPERLRIDGNRHFKEEFVRGYLRKNQTIYDIGGGKQPFLTVAAKREFGSRVIGLDISAEELSQAPPDAYDRTIVADIGSFVGMQDADLVICQALLEHVPDAKAALTSIVSILKPGGTFLLFVPCRNALFARLNLLLPEALKRRLLFAVFPSARDSQGFVSYYDACTPERVASILVGNGMVELEIRRYYMSGYFVFFTPLFVVWRLWTALAVLTRSQNLCETFSMAFRKTMLVG